MDKIFYKMSCQSVSKVFKNNDIYELLFDKRVDKRYLVSSVQKFINLNKKMFKFLGIDAYLRGTDNDLSLSFTTSNYIGAIPVKMPYDGIAHKDFQVTPRFDNNKDVYSELTQLLSCLNYSISPEYSDEQLCLPMQLRPPLYYDAMKYIELFEVASRCNWVKFDTLDRYHAIPKSSTNWEKYIMDSYNPQAVLKFPSRDNILTTNHQEWQELKYVFELARDQIVNSASPSTIKFKYQNFINQISSRTYDIKPTYTKSVTEKAYDPYIIKETKKQANIILKKSTTNCTAWRMDMAQLFERYVQHIVETSINGLSGSIINNNKISGKGNIPSWGLRYLEPDIMIRMKEHIITADVKYKAHFYAQQSKLDVLKETHRADLHQLLAYCSFEPQSEKIGILFYPASRTYYREITYRDRFSGTCNKVILCGIAFGIDEMITSSEKIKILFRNIIG